MFRILFASFILLLFAHAQADEFIQFSDGSTAWRNDSGHVWGKTPSPQHDYDDSQRFEDRNPVVDQHGTVYVPSGSGWVNTQTGQYTPGR